MTAPSRKSAHQASNQQKSASKTARPRAAKAGQKSTARKAARQRPIVVVLGMHRSGTSAMTRVLNLLGAQVSKTLMDPNQFNEKGYWESYPISVLNNDIFTSGGSDWQDWHAFQPRWYETGEPEKFRVRALDVLKAEFDDSSLLVFKDPRVCRLYPFWEQIFEEAGLDPRVVFPLRHPVEVAASLNKRDGLPEVHGLLLWLRNVLDAEYASRDTKRAVVSYDAFMMQPVALATSLQDSLDLIWPRLSPKILEEIEAYIDPQLRHHTAPDQSKYTTAPIMWDWMGTVYETLLNWSANGENKADYPVLDRIRQTFDDMTGPLRDVVANMIQQDTKIRTLQGDFEKRDAQRESAEDAHRKLIREKDDLQKNFDAQKAQRETAEDAHRKLVREKDDLQKNFDAQKAQRKAAEDAHRKLIREKDALQKNFDAQKAQRKAAEAARRKLAREKDALQKNFDAREAEFEVVKSEAATISQEIAAAQENHLKELSALHDALNAKDIELAKLTIEFLDTQKKVERIESDDAFLHEQFESGQQDVMLSAANVLELEEQVQRLSKELDEKKEQSKIRERQLTAQLIQKETDIEGQRKALRDAQNKLEQTQSALHQRTREANQTVSDLHMELSQKETDIEGQKETLRDTRNRLEQTQSALRQRTHETEQNTADMRKLRARHEDEVAALQTQISQLQEQLDQGQNDLNHLHAQGKRDLELRFEEIAVLTQTLIEREEALGSERAQLLQEVSILKTQLDASTKKLQEEEAVVRTLTTENATLLHQSEQGHELAGRMSDTIHAIVQDGVLGGNWVRPLADRRKAHLLIALGLFDAKWYLEYYSDVRENGANPALHFVRHGYFEGRAASLEMVDLKKAKSLPDQHE